ncbi:restriction endonuclease [Streptomyces canus]|uniref:restriction endonuclease n=1 Tax=Streptomyces canus TaxID=58343 RepID=UPI0036E94DA6
MTSKRNTWRSYEDVAVYLLDQIASKLDLDRVEDKQKVIGKRSGTEWEIDGKGVKVGNEGFVIIECRRYTTSKQKQEQVAGLAYRIIDTEADGAIIVSPLGLQEGAAKVAEAENIRTVHMDQNSTRTDYMFRFLNEVFVGASDTVHVSESVTIEVIRGTGPKAG